MLALTIKKNVKHWIQMRPLKEANQAIIDMDSGNARYRYVMVNEARAKYPKKGRTFLLSL